VVDGLPLQFPVALLIILVTNDRELPKSLHYNALIILNLPPNQDAYHTVAQLNNDIKSKIITLNPTTLHTYSLTRLHWSAHTYPIEEVVKYMWGDCMWYTTSPPSLIVTIHSLNM